MLPPAFLDRVIRLLEVRVGGVTFFLAFGGFLAVLQMSVKYLLRAEQTPNTKGPTR